MQDYFIYICAFACIICPLVCLVSIVALFVSINRKIQRTEADFKRLYTELEKRQYEANKAIETRITNIEDLFAKLYKDSEARIDRTNNAICEFSKAAASIAVSAINMEKLIHEITGIYSTQLEKLQQSRDKVLDQSHDLIKTNAVLTTVASTPRNVINNNPAHHES